ncbi:aminotransferase class I/II-fold pyridoxal phosphate-dependent enzyme [Halobacillus sp. ACCC02827]|uniref:aminotransferase class I/II-fold pyridoxal phosphate-dependent enzyme n=1 Tax=Halobacillus sp. ACCC02827 TaxID=3052090 RepID=UPI00256FFD95|nr:aminotransferase class I/II-fold pyridoxal phosphate-dependent enzyme [Halobacillus sp. ACCC02827]WJE15862.1 aminotransferase class I/II-fold pyridoxal phosphate-dependent enzyme [Halobacillus sp. ACCC02827]
MNDYKRAPLYEALQANIDRDPMSFHVPGHKYGRILPGEAEGILPSTLRIDATEVSSLDDLHAPEGVIKEAQHLAASFFRSDETFFLVNGTTVGNLAMIHAVCKPGEKLIVQRNCHKSVWNGLELANVSPVVISPAYEKETGRYSSITPSSIEQALKEHPDSKGVLLTYPDYFGRAYDLKEIARVVHSKGVPLLIDEAHGVHFHLGDPMPVPALEAGADVVVQSAHKMAPAMTMASYMHVQGKRVDKYVLRHYLQMLQSSSPSYPLMASLDLARKFLSTWREEEREAGLHWAVQVRDVFQSSPYWHVLQQGPRDDPFKITLEPAEGSGFELAEALEKEGIVPELATSRQVLLILGLRPHFSLQELKERIGKVDSALKKAPGRATIAEEQITFPPIQTLEMRYTEMRDRKQEQAVLEDAVGLIAAEAVIPYPPGIPILMKGERIMEAHVSEIRRLLSLGARFHNVGMEDGIRVFKGE